MSEKADLLALLQVEIARWRASAAENLGACSEFVKTARSSPTRTPLGVIATEALREARAEERAKCAKELEALLGGAQ